MKEKLKSQIISVLSMNFSSLCEYRLSKNVSLNTFNFLCVFASFLFGLQLNCFARKCRYVFFACVSLSDWMANCSVHSLHWLAWIRCNGRCCLCIATSHIAWEKDTDRVNVFTLANVYIVCVDCIKLNKIFRVGEYAFKWFSLWLLIEFKDFIWILCDENFSMIFNTFAGFLSSNWFSFANGLEFYTFFSRWFVHLISKRSFANVALSNSFDN